MGLIKTFKDICRNKELLAPWRRLDFGLCCWGTAGKRPQQLPQSEQTYGAGRFETGILGFPGQEFPSA